ncbi:unnamed protein product [Mesocestoides corti]|uniref:Uncharacterized protein n=1 Tax=Mesocestoides corti TaxID=53468 RepID=A0A0R3UA08_MESCO|nr:unnamed protein product [Mesocestoides corti]
MNEHLAGDCHPHRDYLCEESDGLRLLANPSVYSTPLPAPNASPMSPKHDMEWAVREVASVCDRDANEIETNIRLLYSNNNCLEEITEALKRARGDRIKAAEFLKQRSNSKKE